MNKTRFFFRDFMPMIVIGSVAIVVSALYWKWLVQDQEHRLQQARQQSAARAVQRNEAAAQQLVATLRSIDAALKHLKLSYLQSPKGFEQSVRDVLWAYPQDMVQYIAVFARDGSLQYASNPLGNYNSTPYGNDRRLFRESAQSQANRMFVGNPTNQHVDGLSLVQITQDIWRAGRFRGVIEISLQLDAAQVLAAVHPVGSTIGPSKSLAEALQAMLPADQRVLTSYSGEGGLFHSKSPFDTVPALFSWQRAVAVITLGFLFSLGTSTFVNWLRWRGAPNLQAREPPPINSLTDQE